jgi:N-acetylmuramoyl-L-alanine amidase
MVKIIVSPSLQEHNTGAGNYGTEETRMNQIADKLIPKLEYNGFPCARNERTWTLAETIAWANKIGTNKDIYIAIHSNAGPTASRGCTVLYYEKSTLGGKNLAQAIYNEMAPITPADDRGIKGYDTEYGELCKTYPVAVIIEVSFHTNPDDVEWIINSMDAIATAIHKGICKFTGVAYKEAAQEADDKEKIIADLNDKLTAAEQKNKDITADLKKANARALVAERSVEKLENKLVDIKTSYKTFVSNIS